MDFRSRRGKFALLGRRWQGSGKQYGEADSRRRRPTVERAVSLSLPSHGVLAAPVLDLPARSPGPISEPIAAANYPFIAPAGIETALSCDLFQPWPLSGALRQHCY